MRPRTLVSFFCLAFGASVAAHAACVSAPLTFTATGIPLVKVSLGSESRRVVFDLGSNTPLVLFDEAQARRDGARFTGTVRDAVNLKGEKFERRVFQLGSITLAGAQLGPLRGSTGANWNAVFGDTAKQEASDRIVGVLGLSAFADRSVMLDYPHKLLRICDRPQAASIKIGTIWHSFRFDKDDDVIVVPTTVEGRSINLFIDTGATSSLVRSGVLTDADRSRTRNCGHFDHDHACRLFSPSALSVGGFALHGMKFLVLDTPAPHDGILGANFLRQVRLLLDLGSGVGRIAFSDPD